MVQDFAADLEGDFTPESVGLETGPLDLLYWELVAYDANYIDGVLPPPKPVSKR